MRVMTSLYSCDTNMIVTIVLTVVFCTIIVAVSVVILVDQLKIILRQITAENNVSYSKLRNDQD